jgi:hypothetical protein
MVAGSPSREPAPHPLEDDELTILAGWAEAVAEALAYAPDRAAALLEEAQPGASWRPAHELPEPSPRLSEAIDCLGRVVQAATPASGAPTFEAVLTAADVEEPGEGALDGLARRVLLAMLEERATRRQQAPRRF